MPMRASNSQLFHFATLFKTSGHLKRSRITLFPIVPAIKLIDYLSTFSSSNEGGEK